jgi:hypothetical protein
VLLVDIGSHTVKAFEKSSSEEILYSSHSPSKIISSSDNSFPIQFADQEENNFEYSEEDENNNKNPFALWSSLLSLDTSFGVIKNSIFWSGSKRLGLNLSLFIVYENFRL